MTTDLEADLRAALHAEALDAPLVSPEWPGPTLVPGTPAPRSGRLLAVAAVMVLAVGATGAVLALRRSASLAPGTHVRPPFLQGREITLEPTDPVTSGVLPGRVVKPGTVRSYLVAGDKRPVTVYDSALNDGYATHDRCIALIGATACIGLPAGGAFLAGTGDTTQIGWVGLPVEAGYVQIVAADGTATWQVPLDGNAVLPGPVDGEGRPRSMTAFDVDGNVVATESFEATGKPVPPPFVPGIDEYPDRALELVDLGRATLRECLARISAQPLPDAAWDACVDEGATAMLARNAELDAAAP